jgi:hypothetical protein
MPLIFWLFCYFYSLYIIPPHSYVTFIRGHSPRFLSIIAGQLSGKTSLVLVLTSRKMQVCGSVSACICIKLTAYADIYFYS